MKKKIGLFLDAEPPAWILRMWEKDRQGGRMLPYLSILDLAMKQKRLDPIMSSGAISQFAGPFFLKPAAFTRTRCLLSSSDIEATGKPMSPDTLKNKGTMLFIIPRLLYTIWSLRNE